jgi:hypothetical protein
MHCSGQAFLEAFLSDTSSRRLRHVTYVDQCHEMVLRVQVGTIPNRSPCLTAPLASQLTRAHCLRDVYILAQRFQTLVWIGVWMGIWIGINQKWRCYHVGVRNTGGYMFAWTAAFVDICRRLHHFENMLNSCNFVHSPARAPPQVPLTVIS